jgi:hypothetical protein
MASPRMKLVTFLGDLEPDAVRAEGIFVRVKARQISVSCRCTTSAIHGSILLMTENNAVRWPTLSFGLLTVLAPWSSLVTLELAGTAC